MNMPSAAHNAIDAAAYQAVNVKPNVAFTVSANNLTVTTNSTSYDPDGTIVSYLWGWGDGGSNTQTTVPTASYTYASAGTYTVVLTVTDDDGATSTTSHSVTATDPPDTTAPSVPTGVNATAGDAQITATWNASTDDTAVSGYKVYVNGTQNQTATGTSATITSLTNGTTYTITVAAYDAAGNTSAQSAGDTATPTGSVSPYTQDNGLGTNGGNEPTGSQYTSYSSVSGTYFQNRANAVGTSKQMSLPAATITTVAPFLGPMSSDAYAHIYGVGGVVGAGSTKTIIEQAPGSSTANDVPTTGGNAYTLLRTNTANALYQDFTLKGTAQTTPRYNGLTLNAANPTVRRVRLQTAAPGNDKAPPGETFGLNLYNGSGGTIQDVEIDGGGTGASNFATNSWTGTLQITRLYTHDNWYSGGIALWQTDGDVTLDDSAFDQCRCFWNIERCTGTVTLNRPRIGTLKAATSGWANGTSSAVGIFCETDDTWINNHPADFIFRINDPRNLDGSTYSGSKITVNFGSANDGGAQHYGTRNFKCYNASGTDISSSFFTYGGSPQSGTW